ncbi:MAG TPA: leucine-rich repeat domain-containing protein [Verrucomicrobiae bacterium]|jgi:hypothetical protein|nr:leucine-rich repeat domain-containing protein [Verrucomicrobiae bacterium]
MYTKPPFSRICLFLILLAWPAAAQAQFTWTTNSGAITITGYTGTNSAVFIPDHITGLPVTTIGTNAFFFSFLSSVTLPTTLTTIASGAFNDCHNFTGTLVVPNSVVTIGVSAFSACNFTNVVLPNSLRTIGAGAFGVSSLMNLTLPNSVTNIGDAAFGNCLSLTNITANTPNAFYSSVNGVLFNQTRLFQYPSGRPGNNYAIPANVTAIGYGAFSECLLTSIVISNNVATIGTNAFNACHSLGSVVMSNNIVSIGDSAFAGCGSLTNVILPNALARIGNSVFAFTAMTNINIPNSVTSIGVNAFENCRLISLVIPATTTTLEDDAFYGNGKLASVTIPSGVTTIGGGAFTLTALTSVTIPATVTSIGLNAFASCNNLTAITVNGANPNFSSVDGVLFNKTQTTLIQYPAGLGSPTYTMPATVTTIGTNAFYNCTNLVSLTLPNTVTTIRSSAFYLCTKLVSLTLSTNVSNIEPSAFVSCSSLAFLTIPASVNTIGNFAFEFCTSLGKIYFLGTPPTLGGSFVFLNVKPGAIAYHLAAASGWAATYGGLTTAVGTAPLAPTIVVGAAVHNNVFGFTVIGPDTQTFVIQTSTNLATPNWQPLQTNSLTGASFDFTDPQWSNYPRRYYRILLQ